MSKADWQGAEQQRQSAQSDEDLIRAKIIAAANCSNYKEIIRQVVPFQDAIESRENAETRMDQMQSSGHSPHKLRKRERKPV